MFRIKPDRPSRNDRTRAGGSRAFTLLEALIASVIMALTVTAVAMALGSGRQHAMEARDQLQAGLAAEALMAEILAAEYADLPSYDGHNEAPGTMVTFDDQPYPETFYRVGRRAAVVERTVEIPDLGVKVLGQDIAVEAYDVDGRVILTLSRFVPEPAQ